MRATLGVFFEEGMSWQRTARRLGVHQNTVMYRVRRAEEILGRPLADRRLELESALRLADAREALRAAGSASGAG
jgi:DNA-binding PucR family transcriptional regulator